ncbi:septation protein IspZ, partial [Vibrio parahaemolyticus]
MPLDCQQLNNSVVFGNMKQILDFIPLIIFFALYKMYDIYVATGALIVATAVQLIVTYALYKKVEKMQLI